MDKKNISYQQKPWLKFYDDGVPEVVNFVDCSLNDYFDEAIKTYPNRIAYISQGYEMT